MTQELAPISSRRQLSKAGFDRLPKPITAAGEKAAWRFIEFFTATIRNKNTRTAYAQAVAQFFAWCEARGLSDLVQIRNAASGLSFVAKITLDEVERIAI